MAGKSRAGTILLDVSLDAIKNRLAALESEVQALRLMISNADVVVKSLTLQSERGVTSATLTLEDSFVQFKMYRPDDGEVRLKLAVSDTESSILLYDDEGFVRLGLSVDESDAAGIVVLDEDMNPCFRVKVPALGCPSIQLLRQGKEPDMEVIWAKPDE